MSLFLALVLVSSAVSINVNAAEISGTFGETLTWTFNESTGEFVINGTGEMAEDYDFGAWFNIASKIKTMTIGAGVTNISSYEFDYCGYLESLTVDSANTVYSSDEYGVLFNKEKSALVRYPMNNSRNSYTIPDGVKYINDSAFSGCQNLTSVTIPDGVLSIGDGAFDSCVYLADITIPDSVTSIGYSAFFRCLRFVNVTIPDSVISIGEVAFNSCHNLETVTIGAGVTSIGERAFLQCDNLKKITVDENNPSYSSDENGILFNKEKTVLIQYPQESLKDSYNVLDSVTSIGNYAFFDCNNLKSVTIGSGVASIGGRAFGRCHSLKEITVDENNPSYSSDENGILFNKEKTGIIQYPIGSLRDSYIIPDGVTSIGDSAFELSLNLKNVTVSDSVTSIGEGAFTNCYNLKNVEIGKSVTTIGAFAFNTCESLESVTLGNSVTSIDSEAFANCQNISDVYYYGTPKEWGTISIESSNECLTDATIHYCFDYSDYLDYTVDENGNATITGYNEMLADDLIIPSTIDGYPVIAIGDGAFYDCDSIESVTIPACISSIGVAAFYDTANLKNITVEADNPEYFSDEYGVLFNKEKTELLQYPSGSYNTNYEIPQSVKTIAPGAFAGSENLKSVKLPDGLLNIGQYSFISCYGISNYDIPETVTFIGEKAFYGSLSLESIIIPENVIEIGRYAFCESNHLTNVTFLGDVKNMGDNVFSHCFSLSSVAIKGDINNIADYAFAYCPNLGSVTFSKHLTNVKKGAFYSCENLTDVYYEGTEEEWRAITIDYDNESLDKATIHFNCEIEKPSIQPETPTDIPEDPSINPDEPSTNPEESTTKPTEPSTKPEVPTTKPEVPTTKPVVTEPSTTRPEEPTTQPEEPTTQPEEPTTKPTEPSTDPEEPTTKPSVSDEPEPDEEVIPQPQVSEIKYGDAMVLRVDPAKIPEGGSVEWNANNNHFDYTVGDDFSCTVNPESSGETTFTATIYDADGNAVSTDEQTLTAKAGFFQKIIGFFKKLFNLTKVYTNI